MVTGVDPVGGLPTDKLCCRNIFVCMLERTNKEPKLNDDDFRIGVYVTFLKSTGLFLIPRLHYPVDSSSMIPIPVRFGVRL